MFFVVGSFVNAFIIIGAFIAANHKDDEGRGLILYGINQMFKRELGSWYYKPLLGCYKCQSSTFGGLPMFVATIVLVVDRSLPGWYVGIGFGVSLLYTLYLCGVVTLIYEAYTSLKMIANKKPTNMNVQVNEKKRRTKV